MRSISDTSILHKRRACLDDNSGTLLLPGHARRSLADQHLVMPFPLYRVRLAQCNYN